MSWYRFDEGKTINGRTLLDEEHELGARITLEKVNSTPENYFEITCGIY